VNRRTGPLRGHSSDVRLERGRKEFAMSATSTEPERLRAGVVHVNEQTVGDEPQMPFGGVKDSGGGRFGGSAVVDEFTVLKWVTVQSGSHPDPF
jgi:hypothetical protein